MYNPASAMDFLMLTSLHPVFILPPHWLLVLSIVIYVTGKMGQHSVFCDTKTGNWTLKIHWAKNHVKNSGVLKFPVLVRCHWL